MASTPQGSGPRTRASRRVRMAVLLSGSGSTLQNLIDRIADGRLRAEVAVVIASRADAGGLERARKAGIPAVAVPRATFPDVERFNDALHAELERYDVDLIV